MKTRLLVGLVALGLIVGACAYVTPVLFQEGNPLPLLWGAIRLEVGGDPVVVISRDGATLMQEGGLEGPLNDYLARQGWTFQDRMGAGILYHKPGRELLTIARQWTRRYVIYRLIERPGSAEFKNDPAVSARLLQGGDVAYQNQELGVGLAYPEGFDPPRVDGNGLHLTFSTGSIDISRRPRRDGATLEQLVAEHLQAKPSPRVVTTGQGTRTLAGYPAIFVQEHFDSAAGRSDWEVHFVLTEAHLYRIRCSTKDQGHPVVPWADVAPICERVLGSLSLGD